jgi:hypothetical protein
MYVLFNKTEISTEEKTNDVGSPQTLSDIADIKKAQSL